MKFRNIKLKYFFHDSTDGNTGGEGGTTETDLGANTGTGEGEGTIPPVEGEGEPQAEIKPFDPMEMTFSEDEFEEKENLEFSGYNLDKYADKINFKDEKVKERFTNLSKEYQEAGFSQEQIEFMLDKSLESESQKERMSDEKIQEDLRKRLSPEVKKNWGTLTKEIDTFFENSKFKEHKKGFMSNPVLMNMFYEYGKSLKGGNSDTLKQKDDYQGATRIYTADRAGELLGNAIKTGKYGDHPNLKDYAKDLYSKVSNAEKAKAKIYLESYM